jgi:hypothetical protein
MIWRHFGEELLSSIESNQVTLTSFPRYSSDLAPEIRLEHLSELLSSIIGQEIKQLYALLLLRIRIVFFYTWFRQEVTLLKNTSSQCLFDTDGIGASSGTEKSTTSKENSVFGCNIVCRRDCNSSLGEAKKPSLPNFDNMNGGTVSKTTSVGSQLCSANYTLPISSHTRLSLHSKNLFKPSLSTAPKLSKQSRNFG